MIPGLKNGGLTSNTGVEAGRSITSDLFLQAREFPEALATDLGARNLELKLFGGRRPESFLATTAVRPSRTQPPGSAKTQPPHSAKPSHPAQPN